MKKILFSAVVLSMASTSLMANSQNLINSMSYGNLDMVKKAVETSSEKYKSSPENQQKFINYLSENLKSNPFLTKEDIIKIKKLQHESYPAPESVVNHRFERKGNKYLDELLGNQDIKNEIGSKLARALPDDVADSIMESESDDDRIRILSDFISGKKDFIKEVEGFLSPSGKKWINLQNNDQRELITQTLATRMAEIFVADLSQAV